MAVKKKSEIKKKVVKKASSKPKKASKASTKNPEFEKAWKNYNSVRRSTNLYLIVTLFCIETQIDVWMIWDNQARQSILFKDV